jgi:hypothetical protein
VKGPSWLVVVPTFDIIKGTSVDYMHCVLLGVCRQLLKLWLLSQYHKEVWYIGTVLDERLANIKPPSEMKRTPRSLTSTRKYWKGACTCTRDSLKPPTLEPDVVLCKGGCPLESQNVQWERCILFREVVPLRFHRIHLTLIKINCIVPHHIAMDHAPCVGCRCIVKCSPLLRCTHH